MVHCVFFSIFITIFVSVPHFLHLCPHFYPPRRIEVSVNASTAVRILESVVTLNLNSITTISHKLSLVLAIFTETRSWVMQLSCASFLASVLLRWIRVWGRSGWKLRCFCWTWTVLPAWFFESVDTFCHRSGVPELLPVKFPVAVASQICARWLVSESLDATRKGFTQEILSPQCFTLTPTLKQLHRL